ncbi:MAG: glycosyltransferase family 4 protein [Dolichospermum sp. BR01]|nr:glycosyltransferase family 4 protein [Dolichospermum sp. BR01]
MEKQNVLYFTSYPLDPDNGGGIAILNDIFQLSQIEDINLYVVVACKESSQIKTRIQLDNLKVKYYLTAQFNTSTKKENSLKRSVKTYTYKEVVRILRSCFSLRTVMYLPFENYNQLEDVSKYLADLCNRHSIQVVIVEQLYSILWFKDFLNLKQRKIYLAFDREAEMIRTLVVNFARNEISNFSKFCIFIISLRVNIFEKQVCKLANKCIFLSAADVPNYLLANEKALVNSQVLPPKVIGWHYTNSMTVLFAGNINHYPNFLAVKWLICELSPRLLRLNNNIKIVITGTDFHNMPKDWTIESNVHIPGFIPKEQLEILFQTSDIFICPIDNDFGVKMKLVECVSYGMPFFATEPCLKALPYLSGLPILDMNSPDEAAAYLCETLSSKEVLEQLNYQILGDAFNFAKTRKDWWTKVILEA